MNGALASRPILHLLQWTIALCLVHTSNAFVTFEKPQRGTTYWTGSAPSSIMLASMLRFASFLTLLPADHDTLDDYGTALTRGILPGIPF